MNINNSLIGQFITIFAIFIGIISYYLGRRKTKTPILAAFLGAVFSIVPVFGLVYVVVLMFKRDISNSSQASA
ncbi:hypothetical protein ACJJI5_03970 [Microbulbifer sp. EKSA008]|uniref:hypothetical protein n=1 Tax=unclassified Microbulbifer TaxID=2619833 RepID=UPI0040416E37